MMGDCVDIIGLLPFTQIILNQAWGFTCLGMNRSDRKMALDDSIKKVYVFFIILSFDFTIHTVLAW